MRPNSKYQNKLLFNLITDNIKYCRSVEFYANVHYLSTCGYIYEF